jgi:hypothetical protein
MRRQTVYAGQVPLETDLLSSNKNTMISIGHVLQDMLGTGTLFSGLGCVPTGPAGMTVNVNPGRAYSLQSTDTGAYSSLASDPHPIVKQGILLDLVNFACPAPTTAGFSINYLIEGAFQEVDGGNVILPYYNAANPAVAFSGPNGTGTSNTTYRDNTVQLQLKPGAAATTGSQVTPTPDSGFTGLWVVTVAFGQVTITAGNITQYAGAPFLSAPLLQQIQSPIPGRLLKTTVYNTAGTFTFTPLAASTSFEVTALGSGGAGGGSVVTNASQISFGIGGNSGAYGLGLYTAAQVGVSQTVTIGAPGAGAAANTGGSGGSVSFGALLSAPGGAGGACLGPTGAPIVSGGAAPGVCTGGIINGSGNRSISATFTSLTVGLSGQGAGSPFGAGGGAINVSGAGSIALGFGSGGGGAVAQPSTAATSAGGVGAVGFVMVKEYA